MSVLGYSTQHIISPTGRHNHLNAKDAKDAKDAKGFVTVLPAKAGIQFERITTKYLTQRSKKQKKHKEIINVIVIGVLFCRRIYHSWFSGRNGLLIYVSFQT